MVIQVLSVFDRAIQSYGRPMFVVAVGGAVRGFIDEVNSKEGEIGKHPDDYDLFHLGEWDDGTARWMQFDKPVCVMRGKDAVREASRVQE